MQKFISLICFIGLVSCGAKKTALNPEINTIYTPELNEVSNSEIGISLASKEKGYTYDAIKVTKGFEVELNNSPEEIEIGQIFINNYSTKKYNLFSNSDDFTFGLAIPTNGKEALIYTPSESDGIYSSGFSQFGMNFIEPNNEIEYLKTKVRAKEKDYFKQEFIYNGRVGDALKFIYREYVNDFARPAFSQNLQYDLSESKIIGFRGLRIEVIEASNTEVKYKVLNHFDK